ncbi:MAG: hypothetical protein ABIQ84_05600, partial [Usitatibacter sp.]
LTLLVVPTFYDSIEIARDRAIAKFHRRSERSNPFFAFVATFVEVILTILGVRAAYRGARKARVSFPRRREPSPDKAAVQTGD